jgi:hypothetical protein
MGYPWRDRNHNTGYRRVLTNTGFLKRITTPRMARAAIKNHQFLVF